VIRRTQTGRLGYVLVEVIVSLVVFSIGMVAVMRTFSVAANARGVAQDYTVGNFLCQKLMSESLAMPELPEGSTEGNFGEEYFIQRWSRTVKLIKVQMVAVPEVQQAPKKRRLSSFRRKLKRRGIAAGIPGAPAAQAQQGGKEIVFRQITVTVSWTRRSAQYSVFAETRVPVRDGAMSNVRA